MKKIIITSILVLTLYTSGTTPTHAIVCSNCSTIVQQMQDFLRQGLQYGKDAITAGATPITALQQTLETVNNTILIPMRDAMTVISVMKSGDAVQNLILGSMGAEPLLVKDPELYFKNKAISAVDANLSVIAGQPNLYGNSVLSSLISANRYNYSDVSTKLRSINQSAIPTTVQKRVCDDTVLTKLAREDVQASVEDGTLDESAYGDRKRELYRALCTGDPNNNPALAATLNKLGTQRPDIGGWDAWLAVTSGDNSYNKTVQSQVVIDQKVQEIIERAKNDLTMGGGIKSLTECKRYASNDLNGAPTDETTSVPCVAEDIKQLSSKLSKAYEEALGAPLDLMLASFGKGAGGLISTAFTTINLVKGISTSFDSATGGSSGSSGGPSNTSNVIVSSSQPAKDLANNPSAKETLTSPFKKQLALHQSSLTALETTDRNYITEIDLYQGRIDSMNSCYGKLSDDYPGVESYPEVAAAGKFSSDETAANKTLRANILKELDIVASTKTFVANTLSAANGSDSSEQLLSLFNSYQNKVDNEGLPDVNTAPRREGEYFNFKGNIEQSATEGGAFYTHNSNCAAVRHRIESIGTFMGAGA